MKYQCKVCFCGVDKKNELYPPAEVEIQRYRCPDPDCPGTLEASAELNGEKRYSLTCYISDCGSGYDVYHFQKDENNLRCPFCQRVGSPVLTKDK